MAVTAVATLAVAGLLTWAGVSVLTSPSALRPAPGLPPDPCSEVGEDVLDGIDGEFSSWHTGVYANGCTWSTSLADEDETHLYFSRSVPLSDADARVAEEFEEEAHANADDLYRSTVDEAGELGYESEEASVVDTEEKTLDLGDESVLVVADVSYGFSDEVSQRVTLVVREGDLVSRISVNLPTSGDAMSADEAEDMLSDVTADIFA